MTLQQMTFMNEPDVHPVGSLVYQADSPVNRTAVLDSARHLVMSVICGPKCGESLAKLNPDGLWLKMFGGYYQAKMDGSFLEFSEILPTWGTMWDGELRAQPLLEPSIDETGWRLLPTPVASDCKGGCVRKDGSLQMSNLKEHLIIFCKRPMRTIYPNPQFVASMMGFEKDWAKLKHTEMQSVPSNSIPSSGR